jgi:hypothetical protein
VNPIQQFMDLSVADRKLLLRAFVLVAAVRITLCALPFHLTRDWLSARARVFPALAIIPATRLSWAIQAALNGFSERCLTQAVRLHDC